MSDSTITPTSVALLKAEDAYYDSTVKVVRVADQVVKHLLIDGLEALRAGDTHITDEFLDRAIRQIQGALQARRDANAVRETALAADYAARGVFL
jgi:hypothetical protein